jgi:indolepyruvate decarboxylase
MDEDDPQKPIAELERQLAEQKRINELERQLAEAKAGADEDRDNARPPQRQPGPKSSFGWMIPVIGFGSSWANFFRPDDVIMTDTGTSSLGLAFAQLPKGAEFHNQTLWASIGWATPAAFGAAVCAPDRRLILITGEGSHQMTAQEISQFGRRGLRPIVFVLNNSGYLSERLLRKDPAIAYNDVAAWNYAQLPQTVGCEGWFTARVSTCGELDDALKKAQQANGAAYIEVVTDADEAPPLHKKLHENVKSFYNVQ